MTSPKGTSSMNDVETPVTRFRKIKEDYAYDPDIMSEEEERVRKIKYIVNNKLSQVDRTIALLYMDCQSFRKLGEMMGLSHMTIRTQWMRIKKIILDEYEHLR